MDTVAIGVRALDNNGHSEIPLVIQQWIEQLLTDKMLHQIINIATQSQEQYDIDLQVSLRGSQGRAVMEPKITIRR